MRTRHAIILALTMLGCTEGETATQLLKDQGFRNIRITGYEPFACSDDDLSHTGFTATSVSGRTVSGTVCCGAFKDCTVRFSR